MYARRIYLIAFLAALAAGPMAYAQTDPVPPSTMDDEKSRKSEPEADNSPPADRSTSDRLKGSEGVIKPPNVDPEMHKSPPRNIDQDMPIIVPPGEGGGDPHVQSK